jgi:hypothetical protein
MVVRYRALQLRICLLSRPLSSHAKQGLIMEEPLILSIVAANVFYMEYAVMIVAQYTQVVVPIVSLLSQV